MDVFMRIAPTVIFFVILLGMGFWIQKKSSDSRTANYSKDYYIGGRSLGGFVLAMTLVATYSSVSSFLSGPGVAWQRGFGWVYLASIQIVAAFIVLGVLGKKMAVIGRKVDAVTVVDVIRSRYNSNVLAIISAIVIIVFFTTSMLGQFIGGATLFSAATGWSYDASLMLFAAVVVLYTTVGGFKAVAITDTACAIIMMVGMGILAVIILGEGGGLSGVMATITEVSATARTTGEGVDMIAPTASGLVSVKSLIGFWFLVGIGTVGLPQTNVRCLSYRDTKAVHSAMIYGTIVVGAMMIGMHLLGVLARGVLFEVEGSTDTVISTLISGHMHPLLAGLTIIGPLAATMSTVSSLLISGSSAIVKDIYIYNKTTKNEAVDQKMVGKISLIVTAVMGIVTIIMAFEPPSIIIWINMFATGGLQIAFFWPLLLGMFWSKANGTGALFSVVGGLAVYCIATAQGISIGGFNNIIASTIIAFILFVIGSKVGKPAEEKVLRTFFPDKF
ncbi:sodium/pantothenate symporter [Chakrabartyella piscis]|uniref:sodium/pantothenate symporter n=1 Tax=Chakrabartyella piscis TaxID=2918914 RepID=UPI0029588231|nr:sodium/pantothenate symporter [Chakrabartyella piscis]